MLISYPQCLCLQPRSGSRFEIDYHQRGLECITYNTLMCNKPQRGFPLITLGATRGMHHVNPQPCMGLKVLTGNK